MLKNELGAGGDAAFFSLVNFVLGNMSVQIKRDAPFAIQKMDVQNNQEAAF